ncbi:HPr-rel-A system PqqD family peptide chaperone [Sphingomonas bacterium]|uniref:HPr-rel-A system PqqD family peptide chaperone n=1 Tax=Sphingomonas bacterium TaxID=1895847 RepID=UPI0020C661EB|nr:HPr-rel-A system PqqD family peptide chaperone [Sphingomonas bacterium]
MTGPRAEPRYRAARVGVLRIEPIDAVLTAVFHRSSGLTHLLAEPAPQILAALGGDGLGGDVLGGDGLGGDALTMAGLLERLGEAFDLGSGEPDALAARLAELVASGLVGEGAA